MPCFLYILRCADGSDYTGAYRGEDIETRVSEHNQGHYSDAYTANRRPVALIFSEPFESITDAIAAERQVKGWSRAKKEAMIGRRWADLPWLAKRIGVRRRSCHSPTSSS
ncbi:MAG: GIY-YIG nuclease family protein [Beijerinckiaceae bacterium]